MKLKKYIFKIICLLLIVCLGVYVCIFAIPNAQDWDIYKQKEINTKIYTVWHIETFEGGGKSRVQYLKNIARSIEKENDGVLFMVSLISPQELSANIASTKPDIISFGFGVGKQILPILNELNNTYEIRDNLIKSATYGNKLMALPYIASGYAKITHAGEIDEWIYGTTGYTSPDRKSVV